MKHLLLILFLPMIFNISLMGQDKSEQDRQKDILDCLVKMGEDTMVTLNICESKYLNFNYQTIKSTFDFHGKRVAFFKGNAGTIKSTKKEYFDRIKYFVNQKGTCPYVPINWSFLTKIKWQKQGMMLRLFIKVKD